MPASSFINTRDVIIEKSAPLLERGEIVAHVIRGLEARNRFTRNRWVGMAVAMLVAFPLGFFVPPIFIVPLFYLLFTALYPRRIILSTDRAVVLIAGGRLRFTPRAVLARLDVDTEIGPMKGVFWRSVNLADRRIYIVPRSYPEVVASDADLG